MNDAFDIRGESHIEVHKFRAGAIIVATLLALVIQASFPIHFARTASLDFPLLVTIYFGLSRRNPSTGLLLGMFIGLFQDSLSGPTVPLGLYGIAKTIIGYLASSIGARLDTWRSRSRGLTCASSSPRLSTRSSPCSYSCFSTACARTSDPAQSTIWPSVNRWPVDRSLLCEEKLFEVVVGTRDGQRELLPF
jgi:rod shape-determining protein MreD